MAGLLDRLKGAQAKQEISASQKNEKQEREKKRTELYLERERVTEEAKKMEADAKEAIDALPQVEELLKDKDIDSETKAEYEAIKTDASILVKKYNEFLQTIESLNSQIASFEDSEQSKIELKDEEVKEPVAEPVKEAESDIEVLKTNKNVVVEKKVLSEEERELGEFKEKSVAEFIDLFKSGKITKELDEFENINTEFKKVDGSDFSHISDVGERSLLFQRAKTERERLLKPYMEAKNKLERDIDRVITSLNRVRNRQKNFENKNVGFKSEEARILDDIELLAGEFNKKYNTDKKINVEKKYEEAFRNELYNKKPIPEEIKKSYKEFKTDVANYSINLYKKNKDLVEQRYLNNIAMLKNLLKEGGISDTSVVERMAKSLDDMSNKHLYAGPDKYNLDVNFYTKDERYNSAMKDLESQKSWAEAL